MRGTLLKVLSTLAREHEQNAIIKIPTRSYLTLKSNLLQPLCNRRYSVLAASCWKNKELFSASKEEEQHTRGYKNFGHKEQPIKPFTKFYFTLIGSLMIVSLLDFKKVKSYFIVDAAEVSETDITPEPNVESANEEPGKEGTIDSSSEGTDGEDGEDSKKKKRVGFRDRKVRLTSWILTSKSLVI
ncbi:hypothetical protein SK128_009511 [Halocaridina rubra]|uniref:Uncharacterized protein n=1 Tax=Halocaridina rubra TaxID=373956 RepID=A0AAN8ZZ99_HALRR